MDAKPFPTAKVSIVIAVLALLAAFVFLVPVKPRTSYPKSGKGFSYGASPKADHDVPGYTVWDLVAGND